MSANSHADATKGHVRGQQRQSLGRRQTRGMHLGRHLCVNQEMVTDHLWMFSVRLVHQVYLCKNYYKLF